MKWTDVLSTLEHIAPTIASAAGGPLAGSAVSAIEGALGAKSGGSDLSKRQDQVAQAISAATPDQLPSLKQADTDFQAKMAELGFQNAADIAKLANDDRASARQREETLKDWTPHVLAVVVTTGFFGILGYMSIWTVPASSKDMLNIMLGSLGAAWVSIVSYYFGSSSESAKKTDLLTAK